jgi:Flp pilus assembly protein TadG
MRARRVGCLRREDGGSLIEFALIAFAFVGLLLTVVEMSRMVFVYANLAEAAHDGARYATVHGSDNPPDTAVTNYVTNIVTGVDKTDVNQSGAKLQIAVNYPDGTNTPGSRVDVTVTYLYDPLFTELNSSLGVKLGSTSEGIISY